MADVEQKDGEQKAEVKPVVLPDVPDKAGQALKPDVEQAEEKASEGIAGKWSLTEAEWRATQKRIEDVEKKAIESHGLASSLHDLLSPLVDAERAVREEETQPKKKEPWWLKKLF